MYVKSKCNAVRFYALRRGGGGGGVVTFSKSNLEKVTVLCYFY